MDARIPLRFGALPREEELVLLEDGLAPPCSGLIWRFSRNISEHMPGCSCCAARSKAASALGAAFRARATGAAPYFTRVLVLASPEGRMDVLAAMAQDLLCRARFRLED